MGRNDSFGKSPLVSVCTAQPIIKPTNLV